MSSNVEAGRELPGRRGDLLILGLSGFVTSFGAHIVATNLPSYAETAGIGAFMIGLLIAVYDFAELFAKPAAGFIADRAGMKRTLLAGLGVFIVGSASFLVLRSSWLLVTRFVQGLGAAALSTVSITLVAKYFAGSRGRSFGIYNALKGAGYVIAGARRPATAAGPRLSTTMTTTSRAHSSRGYSATGSSCPSTRSSSSTCFSSASSSDFSRSICTESHLRLSNPEPS